MKIKYCEIKNPNMLVLIKLAHIQLEYAGPVETSVNTLAEILARGYLRFISDNKPSYFLLTAMDAKKIIGFILAGFNSQEELFSIENLYISKDYTKNKIGDHLLNRAEEHLKKHTDKIHIHSSQTAIAFYEKHNYKKLYGRNMIKDLGGK